MKNDFKKVAVYIRTAVPNDNEVKKQEEDLLNVYTDEHYEIYDIYIDNGYSAVDRNRPAFQRMLKDLKEHKFDLIATCSIDRICRRITDIIDLFTVMEKYDCSTEFLNEYFSTNTMNGKWVLLFLELGRCSGKEMYGNE